MSKVNVMQAGFGAFGKMPMAGDFFRLSPPVGFVRVWDAWLQSLILQGQATYGPYFDQYYMSAPIWRFSLPAGVAGGQKIMGVQMPSVDRVGRRFPLTLMGIQDTSGPLVQDHFRDTAVFEKLEDIALDCLEDTMTVDRLGNVLSHVKTRDEQNGVELEKWPNQIFLTGPTGLSNGAKSLSLDHVFDTLLNSARDVSLWSAAMGQEVRMMACKGLPTGPQAMGLFDLDASIWNEAVQYD